MLAGFNGVLAIDETNSGWIHVRWPESTHVLGTRKPVKVLASVDGHEYDGTLMPLGDGAHMLPVKAAVRKAIGKGVGDSVSVAIVAVRT